MRREPPLAATWMLEHLSSGARDEALSGDLLEEFCGGKADGWYWRQVLAACAVSWLRSLRVRLQMLAFAMLWSMAAPAWNRVCDQVDTAPVWERVWQMCGPFWWILALCGWTLLHASFLWAGIAVYVLGQKACGHRFQEHNIRRAVWLAPLILLPVYGSAFLVASLYWFSWFAHARLAGSLADRIVDVRLLADLLRIPYLAALLGALWGVVPLQARRLGWAVPEGAGKEAETGAEAPSTDSFETRRFLALMTGAGVLNAMFAGIVLVRFSGLHTMHLTVLLARACGFVAVGVFAGAVGAWIYWKGPSSPFREHPPLPFGLFVLTCASGWVWAPAMTIFAEQASAAASFVAAAGTFLLVVGARAAFGPVFASCGASAFPAVQGEAELFTDVLGNTRIDFSGAAIALSLYAAGAAMLTHWAYTAAGLMALAAFLFAWRSGGAQKERATERDAYRRAALRLAGSFIVAILVTAWALLDGFAHGDRGQNAAVGASGSHSALAHAGAGSKNKAQGGGYVLAGYESVVLWPYPEKKQIVAPVRFAEPLLIPGNTQPLVIRFSGSYRYVQQPNKAPGPLAHVAHGTPLGVDIEAQNRAPLSMDAHQELSGPVPTALCREIEVEIANADNREGPVSLALLLSDGPAGHQRTLYLGEQSIASMEREHFQFKSAPIRERLRFAVPAEAKLRRFSEMTVLLLPEIEHRFIAPKIAVVGFEIFPR